MKYRCIFTLPKHYVLNDFFERMEIPLTEIIWKIPKIEWIKEMSTEQFFKFIEKAKIVLSDIKNNLNTEENVQMTCLVTEHGFGITIFGTFLGFIHESTN